MTKPALEKALADWLTAWLDVNGREETCFPASGSQPIPATGSYLVAICDVIANTVGKFNIAEMRFQVLTYAQTRDDGEGDHQGLSAKPGEHDEIQKEVNRAFQPGNNAAISAAVATETGNATINGFHAGTVWEDGEDEESLRFVSTKGIKFGLVEDEDLSPVPDFVSWVVFADLAAVEAKFPAVNAPGRFALIDSGGDPVTAKAAAGVWALVP